MKKIIVFLFAFVSILLVSCGKKDEIAPRRDNPHTDNVELLDLDLSCNLFTSFPDNLPTSLTNLNLNYNQLSTIPIEKLKNGNF